MIEIMFQWPVVTSTIGGLVVSVITYYVAVYIQSINFGSRTKSVKKLIPSEVGLTEEELRLRVIQKLKLAGVSDADIEDATNGRINNIEGIWPLETIQERNRKLHLALKPLVPYFEELES